MLVSLTIRNFALVDRAEVEFGPGLNVITGETGAGKSILIGAFGLLLGNRADKGAIRTGESSASVEAVLHLQDTETMDRLLEEHGVSPCEEGQLILRRVVRASGASQHIVNDGTVPLQVMKEIGTLLVDLHGPHDHQSLFDPKFQLDLLDAYGRHPDELQSYADAYRALRDLQRRREALEGPQEGVAEQIDLLSYRIGELEEANLDAGEEAAVLKEHQTQANAQEIRRLGGEIAAALMESEGAAFDALAVAQRALDELTRLMPDTEEWKQEAESAAIQIQELYRTIQAAMDGIEGDPARLEWLDDRLATYQKMKRKYGPTVDDALARLEQSKEQLQDLSSRESRLAEIDVEIAAAQRQVNAEGKALRKKRTAAAKKLAKAVTAEIQSLGFEQGEFSVEVRETEPDASGMEDVEFGFAPNVGETMRPLRAIASSGEISRVMLATKGVLAELDRIPVLIFDEIAANIGGEMGTVVGRKLAHLSDSHQVLCITHLPQVAVFGSTHFEVSKTVRDERTYTEVTLLGSDERVEEIARMLGGKEQTSVTMDHAREMLRGMQ
jgi:DNA repair protein RecN (Recombination protein N)